MKNNFKIALMGLLLINMPLISSERQRILEGTRNNQQESRIAQLLQAAQKYSPHMFMGGMLCAQLGFTAREAAYECGHYSYIRLFGHCSACCFACGICGALILCNECRKAIKNHAL